MNGHRYLLPTPMLEQLRAVLLETHPEMEHDEQLYIDTIDGQTDVLDYLRVLVRRAIEAETFEEALKQRREQLEQRATRFKERASRLRSFVAEAMQALQLKSIAAEDFTASVRDGRPSVRITDVDALPERFLRTKVEPMKAEIGDALKAGQPVAGAELSNTGPPVLTVRRA